jgi:hypothetical protein
MNFRLRFVSQFALVFLSMLASGLAIGLAIGGCKSSPQQAATQPPANSSSSANPQPSSDQSSAAQPGQPSGAQPGAQPGSPAPQAPPPPTVVDLPVGTHLHVRLDQDLGSRISHTGDSFRATVAEDVVVNGQTVIPRGAHAEGTVIDAKPLGHIKGGALLELRLERVHTNWGSYPVATSTIDREEKGKGKRTGAFAGGGGAFGAIVGGIAGGGKGALIGGLAGAGAGTAGSALTGNHEIVLPAETLLSFHLEHSVHITESQ